MVEEFRAPLAEGLSVYLLNNRIVKAGDFLETRGGELYIPYRMDY